MSRTSRPDKRPPSRQRFEESHPVVALRLPLDVYRRFKEATTATGATAAAWVKEHLDRDDVGAEAIAEALAREKDGLGREVERRRKELDSWTLWSISSGTMSLASHERLSGRRC